MAWYKVFVPDLVLDNYQDLKIEQLLVWNCRLLLLDVDNTLVPYDQKLADQQVRDFIDNLIKAKIEVILISNNREQRVKTFAEDLGLTYYASVYKPLPGIYHRIVRERSMDRDNIVCLGDQLLTDVWGAHNAKIKVIWVKPLVKRDLWSTRINRFFESYVYRLLKKKGLIDENL